MSKISYNYYRVLGTVQVDQKKWDEYGSSIYMNAILDSINNILVSAGFESISLAKKDYYKPKNLKDKMFSFFDQLEKFTKSWDVYPVLVWQKNSINIEIRQKVERLDVNPNDSNKIFRMLKSLMEGEKNE